MKPIVICHSILERYNKEQSNNSRAKLHTKGSRP